MRPSRKRTKSSKCSESQASDEDDYGSGAEYVPGESSDEEFGSRRAKSSRKHGGSRGCWPAFAVASVAPDWPTQLVRTMQVVREQLERRAGELGEDGVERGRRELLPLHGIQLKPYQEEGVRWLLARYDRGINTILADEMGVGKTYQALALLRNVWSMLQGHVLIVCTKTMLETWAPAVKETLREPEGGPVRLVQYSNLLWKPTTGRESARSVFLVNFANVGKLPKDLSWGYLVVDEAHKLQSLSSQIAGQLDSLVQAHCPRLLLTGTPMLSDPLSNLYGLLHICQPVFPAAGIDAFKAYFGARERAAELRQVLHVFYLRRRLKDVVPLPRLREYVVATRMSEAQRAYMTQLTAEGAAAKTERLLQCCDHEGTVPRRRPSGTQAPSATADRWQWQFPTLVGKCGEALEAGSGKVRALRALVGGIHRRYREAHGGHKVVVFATRVDTLFLVCNALNGLGFDECIFGPIYGQDDVNERSSVVERFEKADWGVIVLASKACGEGLTLTSACHLVLFDAQWTEASNQQTKHRVYRNGQTQPVTVYRLLTLETVEEKVLERNRESERGLLFEESVEDGAGEGAENGVVLSTEELLRELTESTHEHADVDVDALLAWEDRGVGFHLLHACGDARHESVRAAGVHPSATLV